MSDDRRHRDPIHPHVDGEDGVVPDGGGRDHHHQAADSGRLHDHGGVTGQHDEPQGEGVRQQGQERAQQDVAACEAVRVLRQEALERNLAVHDVGDDRQQPQEAEHERELAPLGVGQVSDDDDRP